MKKNYLVLRDENEILKSRIYSSDELKRTINSEFIIDYQDDHDNLAKSETTKLFGGKDSGFRLKKNQSMMREKRQIIEEPARDRKYFNEEIRSLDKIKEKLSRLKSDIIQDFQNS